MSITPKALMTQYAEGNLVTRELRDMLTNERENANFERDMPSDIEQLVGMSWGKYSSDNEGQS